MIVAVGRGLLYSAYMRDNPMSMTLRLTWARYAREEQQITVWV